MEEKTIVRDYFNSVGFDRWRRIYGDAQVNWVQRDIRQGHARTVATVLEWLQEVQGKTVCDAGCGVGSLSIPLAQRGSEVFASDISEQMIAEARRRQRQILGQETNPRFAVSDLEAIEGQFDIVVCLDVMIHYPEADALRMLERLTQRSRERLIFSFAPKTAVLTALKRVGEFFPGPSKATRAYQHREAIITERLRSLGWRVANRTTISSRFYFAWILEAKPS